MLKPAVEEALNKQIGEEMYSSYLYLSMSAYFADCNLKGMALWMRYQVEEETMHAMKLFDFVLERGGKVTLGEIKAPKVEWENAIQVFEDTAEHEAHITGCINQLVDLCIEQSDHATHNMLEWFVSEQVEEEANADDVLQRLKLIGDHGYGLLMMDQELGRRPAPTPPAAAE